MDGKLIDAIEVGRLDLVESLLKDGANANARKKLTLLALVHNNNSVSDKAGPTKWVTNKLTRSPSGGHESCSDSVDVESALGLAVRDCRVDIAQALIKAGADANTAVEWRIAATHRVGNWSREKWANRYRFMSFNSSLELALQTGPMQFNKSGSQIILDNPISSDAVAESYTLTPNLEMVRLLVVAGKAHITKRVLEFSRLLAPPFVEYLTSRVTHFENTENSASIGAIPSSGTFFRVPYPYFERIVPPEHSRSSQFQLKQPLELRIGTAFTAATTDEISLQPGEAVRLETVYPDGWGYGSNLESQAYGMFPLNALQFDAPPHTGGIPIPVPSPAIPLQGLSSTSSIPLSGPLLAGFSFTKSLELPTLPPSKNLQNVDNSTPEGTSRSAEPPTVVLLSDDMAVRPSPPYRSASLQGTSGATFQAKIGYTPFSEDELELQVGDLIIEERSYNDGWSFGINKKTGKRGFYPQNFVRAHFKGKGELEESARVPKDSIPLVHQSVIPRQTDAVQLLAISAARQNLPVLLVVTAFPGNESASELVLQVGDHIQELRREDEGWSFGLNVSTNRYGIFPRKFTTTMPSSTPLTPHFAPSPTSAFPISGSLPINSATAIRLPTRDEAFWGNWFANSVPDILVSQPTSASPSSSVLNTSHHENPMLETSIIAPALYGSSVHPPTEFSTPQSLQQIGDKPADNEYTSEPFLVVLPQDDGPSSLTVQSGAPRTTAAISPEGRVIDPDPDSTDLLLDFSSFPLFADSPICSHSLAEQALPSAGPRSLPAAHQSSLSDARTVASSSSSVNERVIRRSSTRRGVLVNKDAVSIRHEVKVGSGGYSDAFLTEVTTWCEIGAHPNILPLLGAHWDPLRPYIVSELMVNGNVMEYLRRTPQTPRGKVRLLCDIAAGMMFLHDDCQIVHADLKPQNVLVDGLGRAVIMDFAFSKSLDNSVSEQITTGRRCGTVAYMSPERLQKRATTKKGDVYAFAMSCYRIWTGKSLFPSDLDNFAIHEAVVNDDIRPPLGPSDDMPPALEYLVRACWERDPEKRPEFSVIMARLEGLLKAM
ncbi:hypothetical protein HDU93_008294 [Gonapodya sp. JEL0774]|nr:hypothetical protein HDU93_008294 [Gonapodya sp. JEL0774]